MIKKTFTYVDFEGTERTEDAYFHLSEAEIIDLEGSINGGLTNMILRCASTNNSEELLPIFKKVILMSYGTKSADGRRFIKSEEATKAFSETPMFSQLYLSFFTDENAASEFFNGVGVGPKKVRTAPNVQALVEEARKNAGATNT